MGLDKNFSLWYPTLTMRKLKELPKVKHGPLPKYPWDRWFDGHPYRLTKEIDFDCSVESMRDQIRIEARKRKIRVRVILEWEVKRGKRISNSLAVQALPLTANKRKKNTKVK